MTHSHSLQPGNVVPGQKIGLQSRLKPATSVFTITMLLNVISWSLLWFVGNSYPMLITLGLLAYGFGLRHAVDADHIAAIDNITRKLLQEEKNPSRVGMYFSFGHSTIVFLLALVISLSVKGVRHNLPHLASVGSLIGIAVSTTFLYVIAIANFLVFRSLWISWRKGRRESMRGDKINFNEDNADAQVTGHGQTDDLLWKRGFLNRLLQKPLKLVTHDWQTYFVGLLFGLGFDTATEVGLLAVSAAAVNGGMPAADTLVLPLLFTSGMSLVDGIDGVMMMHAYSWAFQKNGRRIVYNLIITGLSVLVAVVVGTLEWIHIPF
ncbi:nickel transporter NixA [Alicyclobacillus sp. SO9]|nr:nickel transporter NixA [Alicyclobacillus sp. SO9]